MWNVNIFPFVFQVLFSHVGSQKKYESVQDILKNFFDLQMK